MEKKRTSLANVIKSLKLAISDKWVELTRAEIMEQYNCSNNTAAAALYSLQMDSNIEFRIVQSGKSVIKAYRSGATCITKWHNLKNEEKMFVNLNKIQVGQIINKIKLYDKPAACDMLYKVLTIVEIILSMRNARNGVDLKTISEHALLKYYSKDIDFMRKNNILSQYNGKLRACVCSNETIPVNEFILQQKQLEENVKIPTKEEVIADNTLNLRILLKM